MQHHRISFFGQKTAMILDSADQTDPFIFLRFLKKLPDRWEKPTLKEGKIIKINLLELIAILRICHSSKAAKFETFHKFQGNNTQIKFEKTSEGKLVISITGYQKYLNRDEIDLLTKLLDHVLEEKITHATGSKDSKQSGAVDVKNLSTTPRSSTPNSHQPSQNQHRPVVSTPETPPPSQDSVIDPAKWFAELALENECRLVPGEILAKSERAISFQVSQFQTIWVPISCIGPERKDNDGLWIKEWFLQKKLGDIFPQAA